MDYTNDQKAFGDPKPGTHDVIPANVSHPALVIVILFPNLFH